MTLTDGYWTLGGNITDKSPVIRQPGPQMEGESKGDVDERHSGRTLTEKFTKKIEERSGKGCQSTSIKSVFDQPFG